MKSGPDISHIAALIGDPARANMLLALMDGRALTATELAAEAGITKQTASSHLSQLFDGGLLSREIQGRHRYFRISGPDAAQVIEALIGFASQTSRTRTRTGPKDPALRKARICYDHLAGDLGVMMFDRMCDKGWFELGDPVKMSAAGWRGLEQIGVSPDAPPRTRRPECLTCLDWSARRHHLAGRVGKAVLDAVLEAGWAHRQRGSRVITFSAPGEQKFRAWLG